MPDFWPTILYFPLSIKFVVICCRAIENRKHGLVFPGNFYPPPPVSKLLLPSLGIRQAIKVGRRVERKDTVFFKWPKSSCLSRFMWKQTSFSAKCLLQLVRWNILPSDFSRWEAGIIFCDHECYKLLRTHGSFSQELSYCSILPVP